MLLRLNSLCTSRLKQSYPKNNNFGILITWQFICAPIYWEFIELENLPRNSVDVNPVDFSVWVALQHKIYCRKVKTLIVWSFVYCQHVWNGAIDQLLQRLSVWLEWTRVEWHLNSQMFVISRFWENGVQKVLVLEFKRLVAEDISVQGPWRFVTL